MRSALSILLAIMTLYLLPTKLPAAANAADTVDFIAVLADQADVGSPSGSKLERGTHVYTLLSTHAQTTQQPVIELLDSRGATYRSYWIVNIIWVEADTATMEAVAALDEVDFIIDNEAIRRSEPLDETLIRSSPPSDPPWGVVKINADDVWATYNITGTNAIVAGQDTGYDWDHEALKAQYRGWSDGSVSHHYSWHDAIHAIDKKNSGSNPCGLNSPQPCDDSSHGTHTMGTMIGQPPAAAAIGVAPGAQWIGCRNMERGWGTLLTYIECFQWFVAPTLLNGANADPSMAPHVINNSWSCPDVEGCLPTTYDVMGVAVANVRKAGIVVVAASGNSGNFCGRVNTPAAIFDATLTVGATQASGAIAGFSSFGPVTVDGSNRLKPDVVAPGTSIYSSYPNNSYGTSSGTSMAAPHVAGVVALMISANPLLAGDVDTIERIIGETAVDRTTSFTCGGDDSSSDPNHVYGEGEIDALAAVAAALDYEPAAVTVVAAASTAATAALFPLLWPFAILAAASILVGTYLYAVRRR